MTFEEAMRLAAQSAERGVKRTIRKYASGRTTDEDDLTGVLVGNLDAEFDEPIGGVTWSASILRHRRGVAAEEQRVGADLLIHVSLRSPTESYDKGVLIQSKRVQPSILMRKADHAALKMQCQKMVSISPSSFVFNYSTTEMRVGSASRIIGSQNRNLNETCSWTSYRFFLELFRCPVGDPRIISSMVADLPVPTIIQLSGEGRFENEDYRV